jgi:hypothetical protein
MRGGEPAKARLGVRIRFKQFKHRAEVLTQSRKVAKPQRKKFQPSSVPLHSGVTTISPDFVHANQIWFALNYSLKSKNGSGNFGAIV